MSVQSHQLPASNNYECQMLLILRFVKSAICELWWELHIPMLTGEHGASLTSWKAYLRKWCSTKSHSDCVAQSKPDSFNWKRFGLLYFLNENALINSYLCYGSISKSRRMLLKCNQYRPYVMNKCRQPSHQPGHYDCTDFSKWLIDSCNLACSQTVSIITVDFSKRFTSY